MPQASESVLLSQFPPLGLNLDLVTSENQASATKNKQWQDFASEGSREQLLPPTRRLGLGWDYLPSA